MKENVVLAGFMASGKTTVGKLVSKAIGMPLVDTDLMVEKRAGQSIAGIFESGGEEAFRELEREVISEVSGLEGVVIAVGGGAVLNSENVEALRTRGRIYLLDVPAEEVASRDPSGSSRPLLEGDRRSISELLESRKERYLEAADVVVGTAGRSPREVAERVRADFLDQVSDFGGTES